MASAIRTDFFKAAHSRMTEMNSIRDLFEPAEQPGNSKVSRQQGAASAMQPPECGPWHLPSPRPIVLARVHAQPEGGGAFSTEQSGSRAGYEWSHP